MPKAIANGIEIHYEEQGDKAAPPMLLIMGFGAQLTLWPDELVEALASRGFRVIRYDNRDIGLSHKFDGVKAPGLVKMTLLSKLGLKPKVPYTLADMADDGAGLLDTLGIEKAHIVGASMGGMIAQHFVSRHADKCLSLTTIFSTTGNPKLPPAKPEAMKALVTRPDSTDEKVLVEHGMMVARTIGSPGYPTEDERLRERTTASVRRSFYPEGPTRHLSAIVADGDRRGMLKDVTVPTLVLHGEDDPLVPCEGGRDTAASIPGAKLKTIPGWGHDLPLELVDELADAITGHATANAG
ncbi:MAG: alpha/beta fold hydrolase [Erythrobacter sp.]|jgi:pimeloyl-ACP methyl ester carboxylesterase|uniref:alpha/beta fold hydrolase n=1 Tax=Qipengyuania citrea TaxID=225971 RepID=UPI001A45CC58|nr:alpha/beta fold hydrolase [Qipengyuania citrea]MBL4719302.1 alpha/beta fold hydrolase [Erythrobacter sp.]MCP2018313.1 pimeloyl-ACP methyl ester carboxylesterase [Qipengyuania citrea]MDE0901754.1 alpha/beta fold hydrolase [Erythrobacter sp.]